MCLKAFIQIMISLLLGFAAVFSLDKMSLIDCFMERNSSTGIDERIASIYFDL